MNGNSNGNKKKRRKRIIIISSVVGVVLLFVGGLAAFSRGGTKIDPSKLAKVEKGDLAKSVVATGKVTPIVKVEVKSKASGIVKNLLVDYGDVVKKGNCWRSSTKWKLRHRWNSHGRHCWRLRRICRVHKRTMNAPRWMQKGRMFRC